MASPPSCSGSLTFSVKMPAPLSGFGSLPSSHHLLPMVLSPGILRIRLSWGCAHKQWIPLSLPHLSLPLPNTVVSALTPSCTVLCSCAIPLRTNTALACCTGGTVGGGGSPLPVLTQCTRRADSRSAPVAKALNKIDNEPGDFIFGFCNKFIRKLIDYLFTIIDEEMHNWKTGLCLMS